MMVQFCRYNFAAHFNLFSCLFRPGLSLLHWKGPSFNIKTLLKFVVYVKGPERKKAGNRLISDFGQIID